MKTKLILLALALGCIAGTADAKKKKTSGNPIFPGWYADPEGAVLDGKYWIFPTYSAPYDQQIHFDAFSSKDLVNWTKHENVITKADIPWLKRALWAPSIIEANNKFYLFFGGNDVHEGEVGGIGVAVSDKPEGPYKDALGKPLINEALQRLQTESRPPFHHPLGRRPEVPRDNTLQRICGRSLHAEEKRQVLLHVEPGWLDRPRLLCGIRHQRFSSGPL